MSDPHLTPDDLIDLAHGLREPESSSATMDHLRNCSVCEDRLRKILGDRESALLGPRPSVIAPQPTPFAAFRRRIVPGFAAVAAIAVFAVGVSLLLRDDRSAPADGFWIPGSVNPIVQRNGDPNRIAELRAAIDLYAGRDLTGAIRALESADFPEEYQAIRDLYLASAVELNGDPQRAVELLMELEIETLPPPWYARAYRVLYDACSRVDCEQDRDEIPELLLDDVELGSWAETVSGVHSGEPSRTKPAQ